MEVIDFNKVLSKALDIVDVGIKKDYNFSSPSLTVV